MPKTMILSVFLAALSGFLPLAMAAIDDPQQMVRQTGDEILAELEERKSELDSNPRLIYPLVEKKVLPHFDFRQMAQSAMGRFWRDASEAQKDRVTREFRELLVRTYATALLEYSGQQIEYLPVQYQPGETKVTIQTRIASPGAPPVPINYRLTWNGDKWMVYDVVIDAVSLITNYRSQFAAVVRRGGIDDLIASLADKNQQSAQ